MTRSVVEDMMKQWQEEGEEQKFDEMFMEEWGKQWA